MRPNLRPANPCFSSGPCAKRPGWTPDALQGAVIGRSHRGNPGREKLLEVIDRTRSILKIPDDYKIAIVPASDTGAVEMCMWSMLGERGVDVLGWESFGNGWANDILGQLKLSDVRTFKADYGKLPALEEVDCDRDVVFTWNGTTSGVKVPNADWIPQDRNGLTICDATSAVFAMELVWDKLDVVTYSWQKVMGGEAAHGMIVLSPSAVQRLENYQPPWPMPKLFRMVQGGALNEGLFEGSTINTPSMLCVEDAIDGLKWAESIGGLSELIDRSNENLRYFEDWVMERDWIGFLAETVETRSNTSICFRITDENFCKLSDSQRRSKARDLANLLDEEGVAYDIGSYRHAPPGLRIWGGATVDRNDTKALIPWLDWAWDNI
ncbi:MAG: phosphoserine transaminase [Candidatus Latescibacterota bacterium]|nr:phosphoserine transaminase [Candidatus Latescibacterota bacterium]